MDVEAREVDPLLPSPDLQRRTGRFSSVPNFTCIEIALLLNVFLSGFDATVTASTYTTIGNEFGTARFASWITTSYLITSTAFQPLYGSLSDIVGRRVCVFFALSFFLVGCFGCSVAPTFLFANIMRGITGIGGGGLLTLATIIHSDIIYPEKRGLFQAFQNLTLGFGSICGASLGGYISSLVGWRFCFLLQCPLTLFSILAAYSYINNQLGFQELHISKLLTKVDLRGAALILLAISSQLLVLTLGGNELEWTDYRLIGLGFLSLLLTLVFVDAENRTTAVPIIRLLDYKDLFSILQLAINFLIGLAAYAYLFTLPLLFQLEFGDTASAAGFRLILPALSTPIGGLLAGVLMERYKLLRSLAISGIFIMLVGNLLILTVTDSTSKWLLNLLLMPANMGQGLAYPSSLFTFIYAFGLEHQASSTATVYVLRSIGGVWGVTGSSLIILKLTRARITRHLKDYGLKHREVKTIVKRISQSIASIQELPPDVKALVLKDYVSAIKVSQFCTAACCFLACALFCLAQFGKRKPQMPHA